MPLQEGALDYADYNWATYSSSLPLSVLINTSNLYIQDAMLFYSFPRNESLPNATAAYCSINADATVYSFPDDDYSVNQTYGGYYRGRYGNDETSERIDDGPQTAYNTSTHNSTDTPILESPVGPWKNSGGIPHPLFTTHQEPHTDIMGTSIACFITLHIFLFFFHKAYEYRTE